MSRKRGFLAQAAYLFLIGGALSWVGHGQSVTSSSRPAVNADCQQLAATLGPSSERRAVSRFLECYARLPPQERVKWWMSGTKHVPYQYMGEILVGHGVDTALLLADLVRDRKSPARFYALKLLCDMDSFVPVEKLPLARDIYQTEQVAGINNAFMVVDGRRIGAAAYAVVKWATEQTEDDELRFYARDYSGLLAQEYAKLTLPEVVRQWREAVVKCQGREGLGLQDCSMEYYLGEPLIVRAPASLPALTEMIEHDPNGYVREMAIILVRNIDNKAVRLRRIEEGRAAIAAVYRSLEKGGLKPAYTKKEWRKWLKEELTAQFERDYWAVHDELHGGVSNEWEFYANALHTLFGTATQLPAYGTRPEVWAEFRRFITYLTNVDPYFPSWVYAHPGMAWEGLCHPQFRAKLTRYYEAWQRFKERP